ncbi:hypothetical protein PPL_10037 [Heterostelium album PN500]|uniref:FNIP repeat-containing protein n=1 Tax=Heterostelium pallidum (strain ATCC 26659 / Pp 5 / PN500) TaxID=670386 RepID=D3BQ56_HETP5|nr:hypothetical protein PPL_10037 [Heterostelium album PN500]EFA76276.1 hypothetical protein PPL_10037 [Heterostelium album PN500]|eukprot:XP_020428408.1 hypothetical protein PPL_10037 [Heterostelium album PN500]
MINNDDNESNKIVNLSHLLLSNIIKRLDDNNNCTLIISDTKLNNDYHLTIAELMEIDSINTMNVSKISMTADYQPSVLKKLYQLISDCNSVRALKQCCSLACVLPVNLTCLSFSDDFDEPLLPGYLPPNLTKLKFGYSFNQPIGIGLLPSTLEMLILGDAYNHPIVAGVLPASLRVLKINGVDYVYGFEVGSLPFGLQELCYSGFDITIGEDVLPTSLLTLDFAPVSWMKSIQSLTNLKTLSFSYPNYNTYESFDLDMLPRSLTSLNVSLEVTLTSSLSTSIKHLNIFRTSYNIDEIFKHDRSQYQFESLTVDALKQESLDGIKIRRLKLDFNRDIEAPIRSIPSGVEELFIRYNKSAIISENTIPSSVQKLTYYPKNSTVERIIPNTVKELVFKHSSTFVRFPSSLLPDSLQSLSLPTAIPLLIDSEFPKSLSNFCLGLDKIQKTSILARKLDDNYYLIFGQSYQQFYAAIISKECILFSINCLIKRLDDNNNSTLKIGEKKLNDNIDYHLTLEMTEIRKSNASALKKLYQLISNCNSVRALKHCCSLACVLPVNLTCLSFSDDFNQPLLPGFLPPKLIKLKFGFSFNQPIGIGVLPTSLRVLKFNGVDYGLGFEVGSLPFGLEELCYSGVNTAIGEGVLPTTLVTLNYAPVSWMKSIQSLANLKTLSFSEQISPNQPSIDLNMLPRSLTSLSVFSEVTLTSSLSTSIKHLTISCAQYNIDEIFKHDRSQYQFESLSVDALKQESLDGLAIKRLKLDFNRDIEAPIRSIPSGVEELFIGYNKNAIITENAIPSSVRKLTYYPKNSTVERIIPNTVKELVVKNSILEKDLCNLLPDSLQSLSLPTAMAVQIDSEFPKSLSNIHWNSNRKQKTNILARKIDDKYYLIFGRSTKQFYSAIIFKELIKTKYILMNK